MLFTAVQVLYLPLLVVLSIQVDMAAHTVVMAAAGMVVVVMADMVVVRMVAVGTVEVMAVEMATVVGTGGMTAGILGTEAGVTAETGMTDTAVVVVVAMGVAKTVVTSCQVCIRTTGNDFTQFCCTELC